MSEKGGNGKNGRYAAVILAAGYSSRMGDFKPVMSVGGQAAAERLIKELQTADMECIMIVTGHGREKLVSVIEGLGAEEVYNHDFDSGMFSSIKAGIEAASRRCPDAEGFFIVPVDCPLISKNIIEDMTEHINAADSDRFCVPVFEGKKGHPLYIPRMYIEEICRYDGSGGLKAVTDRYWDRMDRVPVEDEGCILDMDTPEGYKNILEFLRSGCRREKISKLAVGRRIFLVRHGQTRQHDEKMMIGQYDVPLNDDGRKQMKCTAGRIAGYAPDIKTVYSSDLSRAMESAEILARGLAYADEASVKGIYPVRAFREIALGPWDGVSVREIKEKHPDEYERRGKDFFSFKIGNKAENFYDVQYRAVCMMRSILNDDDSRDIIIVSHSGVIRALENNLKGKRVDDPWEEIPKGGFVIVEM